jgi:hypothetical protein
VGLRGRGTWSWGDLGWHCQTWRTDAVGAEYIYGAAEHEG